MPRLHPDMVFIRALNSSVDNALKKCIQCGTCSAGCGISPSAAPFPRKEMAMASYGMKDALVRDRDVWLCYQCNDCTRHCPRSARPGDVLAAIRKETIVYFAFPSFLAKRIARPRFLPLLVLLPVILLGAAALFQAPFFTALHIDTSLNEKIVYAHSAFLPHPLLNLFFFCIIALSSFATAIGVGRFWRALKARALQTGEYKKVRSIGSSIAFVFKSILTHDRFDLCEADSSRWFAHFCVLFGFFALLTVTLWIITAGGNPLLTTGVVYPFSFLSPFKILANLGGAALLFGMVLMIRARLKTDLKSGRSTYFDWLFLLTLFFIVITGFATEGLHYLRIEPQRHVIYFVHLVSVTMLLLYLPYTKFAHAVYRTAAVVFARHIGREGEASRLCPMPEKGEGDDRA